jgi:DNA-binding CsgD family transcriptional regulator
MPLDIETSPTNEYKRLCDLFSELWSADIALLSLSTLKALYIPDNLSQLLGVSNEDLSKDHAEIFTRILHPKELSIIKQAHIKTLEFYAKLYKSNSRIPYVDAKYYLKIKTKDGEFKNFSVLIHPIFHSGAKFPLACFALLTPNTKLGFERFSISFHNKDKKLYYSSISDKYVQKENLELKEVENEILRLTAKGFGETKIAKELDIKLDLVRYYKKNIYKKFHVSNMSEAVFTALNNNLI